MKELKRSGPSPKRYFIPYFVLVLGLLLTAFFSYYTSDKTTLSASMIGGLFLSLLLFLVVHSQIRARDAAEKAA